MELITCSPAAVAWSGAFVRSEGSSAASCARPAMGRVLPCIMTSSDSWSETRSILAAWSVRLLCWPCGKLTKTKQPTATMTLKQTLLSRSARDSSPRCVGFIRFKLEVHMLRLPQKCWRRGLSILSANRHAQRKTPRVGRDCRTLQRCSTSLDAFPQSVLAQRPKRRRNARVCAG